MALARRRRRGWWPWRGLAFVGCDAPLFFAGGPGAYPPLPAGEAEKAQPGLFSKPWSPVLQWRRSVKILVLLNSAFALWPVLHS